MNNNTNHVRNINTLKFLGIDAINKANSGHPGIVISAAPMMYTIYANELNITSKHPFWINRDRFVLSAGHGSALMYSMLTLMGYLKTDDLKEFRQFNSLTPGHPESELSYGVDATTGPLGQGISNGVGMALAESHLAAKYNKPGFPIFDHQTFVVCGDGDLQEGVGLESIAFAGRQKLDKLVVLYDSNDVQLDDFVKMNAVTDWRKILEANNWHYQIVLKNDYEAISQAIDNAKKSDLPSFIEIKTIIGEDTTKAGTSAVHGAPIGAEERAKLANKLNWPKQLFAIPGPVKEFFDEVVIKRGEDKYAKWDKLFKSYSTKFPKLAKEINFDEKITIDLSKSDNNKATREYLGEALNQLARKHPQIIGGTADLSGSTKAKITNSKLFDINSRDQKNISFGVREFAMTGIVNGMQLHGGLRAFGSTFFVFSDYLKPALRLAALQKLPITLLMTHDSIFVGEDGPTHQPVEQLAMLRSIPNVSVFRPADENEMAGAFEWTYNQNTQPSVIIGTRQAIESQKTSCKEKTKKGAYILVEENHDMPIDAILAASGSEVTLAMQAYKKLISEGKNIRVVSMPNHNLFVKCDKHYQNTILPANVKKIIIEAGSEYGLYRFAGPNDHVIALNHFGHSGKGEVIYDKCGFNVKSICELI